ncbi:MAG: hypothetical protein U1E28_18490 [Beijerinckiaceae bacterium]
MSAIVIQFRRNYEKEIDKLIAFNRDVTVEDMLRRHQVIGGLLDESTALAETDRLEWEIVYDVLWAWDELHNIARRAGVDRGTIDAFNMQRTDWSPDMKNCYAAALAGSASAKISPRSLS